MNINIDFYKYARALSELSKDNKKLEQVQEDLTAFNNILEGNAQVFKFLKHPGITLADKNAFVKPIAEKLNFSKITQNFIKLLLGEGKIEHLKDILNSYNAILRAINREVKVEVQAAYAQDKKSLNEIKEVLSKKFGCKIILKFSQNKNLVGGFRIIARNRIFDCSVKSQLEQMEKALK